MWGIARQIDRFQRGRSLRAQEPVRTGPAAEGETPGGEPSAALSLCLQRCQNLTPEVRTLGAFVAWWVKHDGPLDHIDDVEELQALYTWMRRSAGWQDTAKATAPLPVDPEPIRQPIPDKPLTERAVPATRVRTTLKAAEAAERFVEWVQMTGKTGSYSSQELTDLYRAHCHAEDLVEVPENMFRAALIQIDGVRKTQLDTGDKRGKRRHRPFRWTILRAATVSEALPWIDLPQRRAA